MELIKETDCTVETGETIDTVVLMVLGVVTDQKPVVATDTIVDATDTTGDATDTTGGATDTTGGATDTTGGATDTTGGATDTTGGSSDEIDVTEFTDALRFLELVSVSGGNALNGNLLI